MNQILIITHVIVGLGIISLVMMQQGKGADAGAAFGGGSSGSLFGASGAGSFLSRATAVFAVVFFTTSLGLAFLGGNREEIKDLMDSVPTIEESISDLPLLNDEKAALPEDVPVSPESEQFVQEIVEPSPAQAADDLPGVVEETIDSIELPVEVDVPQVTE